MRRRPVATSFRLGLLGLVLNAGCDGDSPPGPGLDSGSPELGPLDGGAEPDLGLADADAPDAAPLPSRRVFATAQRYNGNLGGVPGADAKCQAAADGANLGGEWRAWISTSAAQASLRFEAGGAWVQVDGATVVFDGLAALSAGARAAVSLTETGAAATGPVWTGTDLEGRPSLVDCESWTTTAPVVQATVGTATAAGAAWTDRGAPISCTSSARLYCFEQ